MIVDVVVDVVPVRIGKGGSPTESCQGWVLSDDQGDSSGLRYSWTTFSRCTDLACTFLTQEIHSAFVAVVVFIYFY